MMEAPPYSPTARASERRLPLDYFFHVAQDDENGNVDVVPLSRTHTIDSMSSQDPVCSPWYNLPSISSSSSYSPELPPRYAAVDELARSFRLEAPYIYTTKTSNVPRYQLKQEFTQSGKPRRLSIRRLMASESRSYSLPSSLRVPADGRRIHYDEEGTMYSITSYEMRGHRSSTLTGSIQLESGKSLRGGRWTKLWQYTRNSRRDSLNPENEAKTQKYGYHGRKEWDKKLLFCARRGVWEDGEGRVIARESSQDGQRLFDADIVRQSGEKWLRDMLVASWVMRLWTEEGLRWENDIQGW